MRPASHVSNAVDLRGQKITSTDGARASCSGDSASFHCANAFTPSLTRSLCQYAR